MLDNLKTALKSFYNSSAYATVVGGWKGFAIKYLVLLSLICSFFWSLKWWLLLGHLAVSLQHLSHDVPGICLRDGRILMKSEMPLIISTKFRKRPLLVIDTTTGSDAADYQAPLVVHEQDIKVYGFQDEEVTTVPKLTLPLKDMLKCANFEIDPLEVAKFFTILSLVISMLLFLGAFAFFLALSILQAFAWGFVGLLIARRTHPTAELPSYRAFVRVAALALTPSLAIRAVTALFGLDLPLILDIVVVAVYFGYLMFAYRSVCPKAVPTSSQRMESA